VSDQPSGARLFVFGFGYSARAAVSRMRQLLSDVWGTTRDPEKFGAMEALDVTPLLFGPAPVPSGSAAAHPISAAVAEADHILVSIAPSESGDPVLASFRSELAACRPKSLVYLSTVGVYGDHAGAWVDETSECRPVSRRSRQRVDAEAAWRAFAAETGVPVAIIRLAGIYGPGRGPFEKIRRGTARRVIKAGQVFNRIHVDDIAATVEAAFIRRADGIFNGADDEPAPPQDVLAYAATLLGVPPPPEVEFADADLSPMARTFYGENKRVRNDKIKRELGIALRYPTYREGLQAVLRAEAYALGQSGSKASTSSE
jgi:nucleoside-diphosphate-sugar epimerase